MAPASDGSSRPCAASVRCLLSRFSHREQHRDYNHTCYTIILPIAPTQFPTSALPAELHHRSSTPLKVDGTPVLSLSSLHLSSTRSTHALGSPSTIVRTSNPGP